MKVVNFIVFFQLVCLSVFSQSEYEKTRKAYIDNLRKYSFSNLDTFSIDNKQVLVYHFPFQIGKSEIDNISKMELENMFFKFYAINKRKIKNIQIFGHTDLFETSQNEDYDYISTCHDCGIPSNSNNCLGLVRAIKVHEVLKEYLLVHNKREILNLVEKPQYHDNCFLKCCDKIVNSKLLKQVGILEFTNQLEQIIYGLESTASENINSISVIRQSDKVQLYLKNHRDEYVENFKPFRCVVIINTY